MVNMVDMMCIVYSGNVERQSSSSIFTDANYRHTLDRLTLLSGMEDEITLNVEVFDLSQRSPQ